MQDTHKNNVDKLLNTFGRIVEKHRKDQHKTAYKISAETTLSKTCWREVELGQNNVKFTTLWKIAEGLDIPMDSLMRELINELGKDFSLFDE